MPIPTDPPVALAYVAHRRGASLAATRRALPWLISVKGFPPPLPLEGRSVASARARWDRRAVDAWFDLQIPEHLRAVVAQADAAGWAAQLDARAAAAAAGDLFALTEGDAR